MKIVIWKFKRVMRALTYYAYSSVVSKMPFYGIRHYYLRNILGIQIGNNSSVLFGVSVMGSNIIIGDNTVVNNRTFLDGRFGITIGNNCSISMDTCILSLSHDMDHPKFLAVGKQVKIDDHVWVGTRAMILPGVHLGEGCVVAAGAVVTKDVPAWSVVAGIPARHVKMRKQNVDYRLRYFPLFDTDISTEFPK